MANLMLSRRRTMLGLAAMVGLAPFATAAAGSDRLRLSGRAFGTGWTVLAPKLSDPGALATRIHGALAAVDAQMSPFRADSEISRFNTALPEMAVSADFAHVADAALRLAATSAGAFDPTVGPAVHRYGFGPIRGPEQPGDWRQISVGERMLARRGEVTLDLCGIAKGHAVDILAGLLRAESDDFLVEIGGEIRAGGRQGAGGWLVGIADPVAGGVHSRIRLADAAVATSGDAVNAFGYGGRRYGHIIDPASGKPLVSDIASVSVIADSAMRADGMATALMVMGPERGLAFADSQGVGVLYLLRAGTGVKSLHNAAFAAHLA